MRGVALNKESIRLKAAARRVAKQEKLTQLAKVEAKEAKIREAFTERHHSVFGKLPPSVPYTVAEVIQKKAPKLLESGDYLHALSKLSQINWVRPIADWEPKGKGKGTNFRSLCEHLLAKYPMPAFLWSAFFEDQANAFTAFVVWVALGHSPYEAVKKNILPVPLTRKMCHALMASKADMPFFKALRQAQIQILGGSPRFFANWMKTQAGQRLHSEEMEAFWATTIEWFTKQPMVDPAQMGPLVDYIIFRRNQNDKFTMTGRSFLAFFREMQAWHATLGNDDTYRGASMFETSGFKAFSLDHHGMVWEIREILTAKALIDESRKMAHCAASYAPSITSGRISLWSLTATDPNSGVVSKALTVEVQNVPRVIVQARGKYNRLATTQEIYVLTQWAAVNNLRLSQRVV